MYTYTLHSEITNHFHTLTNTHLCKKPPLICDHFPRIPILVTIKSLWSEHGSSRTIASPDLTPAQYWINKKMVYNRPSADRAIFSLCWLRKLAPVFHEIRQTRSKTTLDFLIHVSPDLRKQHKFCSNFNCFILLSVSFMFVYSNYLGFGFSTL